MDRGQGLSWAGAAAGLVNGLFGGSGGAVLTPLLQHCGLPIRSSFATSLAVMLPLSMLSAGIYWWKAGLSVKTVLPYLLGGLAGGAVGGWTMEKICTKWLQRLFALFLLYGSIRYLT